MPRLDLQIEGSEVVQFAAAPTIAFKLHIASTDTSDVRSIALQSQIQIESTRRHYSPEEKKQLFDLFGEPQRWSQTLRAMHWTQVNTNIPGFKHETTVNLLVPCSFDFNVAATKYFASLQDGEVPLCFLFSGTVFYQSADGRLQIEQIPWEKEASYRLPVSNWRKMMDVYYPNEKWLSIRGDIFERLSDYKRRRFITTWDQAFEDLLSTANIDDRPLMTGTTS